MPSLNGSVMVRHDGPSAYFVVDVDTEAILAGPFALPGHAFGYAHSIACKRGSTVLEGLHHDMGVLTSKLREAQGRVEQLADDCRHRAEELREATVKPKRR